MHAVHEQLLRALVPLTFAVVLGAQLRAELPRPPMDTPVEDGACRAFTGAVSGNDPDVRVRLTLCRQGYDLRGQLVWNGRSGTSVRDVLGELEDPRTIHMTDAKMLLDAPNPGWAFCPVDMYALTWDPTAGALSGSYVSASCDDTAGIWLAPAR